MCGVAHLIFEIVQSGNSVREMPVTAFLLVLLNRLHFHFQKTRWMVILNLILSLQLLRACLAILNYDYNYINTHDLNFLFDYII